MILSSLIRSGHLDDRSKPTLFSMARLDRVKNITGLVEAFAKCAKLRELVNLVVVAGYNDVNKSKDREEIAEIEKMHELIKTHNLFGQFRWISAQTNRARNGELYRYIADTHGAFVQVYIYIYIYMALDYNLDYIEVPFHTWHMYGPVDFNLGMLTTAGLL
jgi:glycosyltransferase involved in cell wall biosynthesis